MSTFCDQVNQGLNGQSKGFGNTDKKEDCGCGNSSEISYEPLTKEWFKEYAGIIALLVTIVMIIARNN